MIQPASTAMPTIVPAIVRPSPRPTVVDVRVKLGADTASVPAPTAAATQVSAPLPAEVANDPRYAFLLLGYGGSGHDGAYLTDSIMVVIVNPDQKTLTLLSIPRDTWVPLAFGGSTDVYNKVNTAYAFAQDPTLYPDRLARYSGQQGPGNFAADTVSRVLGIPIRYYVGLDFAGFRQMIDAVGGIDVDVPAAFAARYPANDDPSIDASWTVVRFAKGNQHMGGERAIEYARARETIDNPDEGTDFARSRRQRLIIEAFKQQVYQPSGLLHLPQILSIGAQHVDTNYALPDAASLSQLMLDWKSVTIYQTAISDQNYLEAATGPDGTYALVPSSPKHDWAQIQAFARRLWIEPRSGTTLAQTPLVVENDTGIAGTAGQLTDVLRALGYSVGDPTTGSFQSASRLIDGTGQHAAEVLAPLLRADLGLTNLEVVTDSTGQFAGVTLQLGADDVAAARIAVPANPLAPASAVGIDKFGVWAPDSGSTTDAAGATAGTAEPQRTPESTRTGSPGPSTTGTPRSSTTPGLMPTRLAGVSETPLATVPGTATPVGTHVAVVTPTPVQVTSVTPSPNGSASPAAKASPTPVPKQSGEPVPTVTPTKLPISQA